MRMRHIRPLLLGLILVVSCAHGRGDSTFEVRKRLTREMISRGEWATAFAYADGLHREAPRDAEVLTLRAVVFRERGLPSEAEADLRSSLEIDEKNAEAHAALGILLDHTARGQEAEGHHRRAVALAPQTAAYLNNLGFSLFLRAHYKDALTAYQQAARLDPTNRRLRTNLGFALAASGDMARAAREFELGGTEAEAKNNLGFAYERRGDLTNAYDLYLAAVRLDPASRRARSNLAHVSGKLGKELPVELKTPPAAAKEASSP